MKYPLSFSFSYWLNSSLEITHVKALCILQSTKSISVGMKILANILGKPEEG